MRRGHGYRYGYNNSSNLITAFLIILIILVFGGTVYFCLDVFGVIKVPAKYSIASLFYSQIETIVAEGQVITEEEIINNEEILQENTTVDSEVVIFNENDDSNEEDSILTNIENPLDKLHELEQEQQNQILIDNEKVANEVDRFYYSQLDEYGKLLYDKLYNNIDKLKTGSYTADYSTAFDDLLHTENGTEILNNSFQLAINALTFDNPSLFYIDITKINLITEIITKPFSTTYKVKIGGNGKSYLANEFRESGVVKQGIDNVNRVKNDIIDKTGDDDVENLKIVHDYLVDTVSYDMNWGKNVYTIYGTLVNQRAVCEGYARTYKTILDELGIPCIIACGIARNNEGVTESHAWNYVYVNDAWYAIDVTWDDPILMPGMTLDNNNKYRYFLKGSDEFFKDHFEDGNIAGEFQFEYPELSKTNY